MEKCIFCDIVAKKAPAEIVHEDDDVVAFKDIAPNAPVHLVVIPKEHHPNLDEMADETLWVRLTEVGKHLGKRHSPDLGYRLAINSADQADVSHIHMHVLGGLERNQTPAPQGGD